jgi:hypothetical protein
MPHFDSIPAMISECFDRDISRERHWYQRYKQTHEKIIADPISDDALELLWYVRDNAVSNQSVAYLFLEFKCKPILAIRSFYLYKNTCH